MQEPGDGEQGGGPENIGPTAGGADVAAQPDVKVAAGASAAAIAAVMAAENDHRKFAILRRSDSRWYILGAALSMMADNIEHVITYWVLWEMFESSFLVGFQIVSHWLPFLMLSVYAGSLAERFDCRRLIQIAQLLFMFVSLCWGILFMTGNLQIWQACVLLVIHGIAGCLWAPAEQMMLYDFAGPKQLASAVRINATFRALAFLVGPVVGSGLLLFFGPTVGIFINIAFYLPLTLFLLKTPFTGHTRAAKPNQARLTLISAFKVLGTIKRDKQLVAMLLLAALAAITIGAVLQNAMPEFAKILGPENDQLAYGVLLFALGAGGVVGGFFLEASGWIPANSKVAVISATLLGVTCLVFAITGSMVVAIIALVAVGFTKITSESTEMSIVQLRAPDDERGRVIGAYSMFGPGMMTFSGVTVAVLGAVAGIPGSVLIGGIVLTIGAVLTGLYMLLPAKKAKV